MIRTPIAVFSVLVLVLTAERIEAQGCEDYSGHLRWIGRESFPGLGKAVTVSGSHAYVADSLGALHVIDISVPESPARVGSVSLPGNPLDVVASGSYAYVATKDSGVVVVDVSIPAAPARVASIDTPGLARGIAHSGSYLYVADGASGLQIISIANPLSPTIAGVFDTPGVARDVAVSGNLAYVADSNQGFRIVDVQNAAAPFQRSFVALGGSTTHVAIGASHAYALADEDVHVILVSNPDAPQVLAEIDEFEAFTSFAVTGDRLYGTFEIWGFFKVFDIATPSAPVRIGALGGSWGQGEDVAVGAPHVYVVDASRRLHVFDPGDGASVDRVGGLGTPGTNAIGVDVAADIAYVGLAPFGGVRVVDVSDPVAPMLLGSRTMTSVYDVTAVGSSLVYVSRGLNIVVVDASVPSSPQPIDTLALPASAFDDLAVSGNYAFAACDTAGLVVVDVSAPASPAIVGALDLSGFARAVDVAGGYAYVATRESGLQIVDITTPTSPVLVGGTTIGGPAMVVSVSGGLAAVMSSPTPSNDSGFVAIVDVSVPSAPVVRAIQPLPAGGGDVQLSGDRLYVVNLPGCFHVFDLSDPDQPVSLSGIDLYISADLRISGDLVYIADDSGGLAIVPAHCAATGLPPMDSGTRPIARLSVSPNPMVRGGRIFVRLPVEERASLDVIDLSGRRVVRILDGVLSAGENIIAWDGNDHGGRPVAAGRYVLRLVSPTVESTARLTLLR